MAHSARQLRLRWVFATVALLLAAGVSPARADERANPLAALPHEVQAGQRIVLTWQNLPHEVEELEILLSLDDGHTFPIRVSPEIEAHERHYRWRVPNLASGSARLRVRANLEGAEVEFEPSEAFTIRARTDEAPELDLMHEGEWWRGLDAHHHSTRDASLGSAQPVIARAEEAGACTTPPRVLLEPPSRPATLYPMSYCTHPGGNSPPARDTKPSFVPARK